MRRHFSSIA
jgi:hypothetical protein